LIACEAYNEADERLVGLRAAKEATNRREEPMITCDLCGEAKDCLPKEIEGREYDICSGCWNTLAQKLKGKGRRIRGTVLLPPPRAPKEREEEEPPLPGETPKIWGARDARY
jgi:hypothetical protein